MAAIMASCQFPVVDLQGCAPSLWFWIYVDIILGARTFKTNRVSFPEKMMFTPLGSSSTYSTK